MTEIFTVVYEEFVIQNGSHVINVESAFTDLDCANQYCLDRACDEYQWNLRDVDVWHGTLDWKYIAGYGGVDRDCGHIVITTDYGFISFYVQRTPLQ